MLQRLFSHHIFRYVILWEACSDWLGSKTSSCLYNKGDLSKQGWHWEPSSGGDLFREQRGSGQTLISTRAQPPCSFSPSHEHCRPQGVTRFPGNGCSPDSDMQLCAGNGSRLSCYAFIISFTVKYLLTNCEQGPALLMEGAAWENKRPGTEH